MIIIFWPKNVELVGLRFYTAWLNREQPFSKLIDTKLQTDRLSGDQFSSE